MLEQTKRQVKVFFLSRNAYIFHYVITAVCFLFLLNGDVIYHDDDDNNYEEDDDEDKHFIRHATALKQTAS